MHHKEKFMHTWTNNCAHMGNQTIGRFESQHSSFKYYLGSGSSSFDTLFKRANAQMTNQQSKIRHALQKSINSITWELQFRWMQPLYKKCILSCIIVTSC